jgi:hypothetical protein
LSFITIAAINPNDKRLHISTTIQKIEKISGNSSLNSSEHYLKSPLNEINLNEKIALLAIQ